MQSIAVTKLTGAAGGIMKMTAAAAAISTPVTPTSHSTASSFCMSPCKLSTPPSNVKRAPAPSIPLTISAAPCVSATTAEEEKFYVLENEAYYSGTAPNNASKKRRHHPGGAVGLSSATAPGAGNQRRMPALTPSLADFNVVLTDEVVTPIKGAAPKRSQPGGVPRVESGGWVLL